MDAKAGPFVAAALISERVTEDADGNLDFHKVLTKLIVSGRRGPAVQPLTVTLLLRPGELRGIHRIGLRIVAPNGELVHEETADIDMLSTDAQVGKRWPLGFTVGDFGTYAFEFSFDGAPITKAYIRVWPAGLT